MISQDASSYVPTSILEALCEAEGCGAILTNWPFSAPRPPATTLAGQTVHHAGEVFAWFANFMTMSKVADAVGATEADLAKWHRHGIGPKGLVLGRRPPKLFERGRGITGATLGDEILIYERDAVDRWLNPQPPGRHGSRS